MLEDWLNFSVRKMSQEETSSIGRTYLEAFTGYSDKEITDAAAIYREEGEYFPPKPRQILDLVKDRIKSKHDEELRKMWTCSSCGQKVSTMSEGRCLDCRGVPIPEYRNLGNLDSYDKTPYRIEGRIQCSRCGLIGECIKEPVDSGDWLCVQCYSGLTRKQIAARFGELARIMSKNKVQHIEDENGDRIPY